MKTKRIEKTLIKTLSMTLLLCMLVLPTINPNMQAYATEYKVGVKVGDWAKYKISIWWNQSYVKHPIVVERENVDTTKIEVTAIEDLDITILLTTYFKNGSDPVTESRKGNIKTQEGLANLIVSANLNLNDKTSTVAERSVDIQSIQWLSFAGRSREVVYGNWVTEGDYGGQTTVQAYWDRETGIQCGIARLESTSQANVPVDLFAEQSVLIETNRWTPEILPTNALLAIGAFAAIVIVLFIVFWRLGEAKEKKRRKRR